MSNASESTLTRRRLLQLFGAAGVGVLSAACAGPGASSGGSTQGAAAPSTAASGGKVEGNLSFAHWRAEDKEVFAKIIDSFQKANQGVTVRQDISPSNDYQSTALQKIRGGASGDVFVAFRGAQFNDMVKAGVYTDMTNQPWASNFDPQLVESGKVDGKQLGFPYQIVFNMLVVNKPVVDKATGGTMPKDWDSFLAMCDKLKSQGLIPIAWPGGDPGNAGQIFNSMVMNNAPSPDMCAKIESGEYKCTDDWFVKTLKQYAQLRPYFQPNSTGTAVEPCEQLFASGKAAMLATGNFHVAAVRKLGGTFPIDMLSPITVPADQMKFEGVYNATFVLGVNSASKHQPAAVKFVEYLSQPDVAGIYANGTSQHVSVKNVEYTNPDLKAVAPWLSKKTILAPRFQFNNLDIRSAVEGACVQVVGGKAPEQAAAEAQHIVDQKRSQ